MKPRLLILSFVPIDGDPRVGKQVRRFVDDYAVTTCSPGPSPHPDVEHVEMSGALPTRRSFFARLVDEFARRTERFERLYFITDAAQNVTQMLGGREFDAVIANDAETVGIACALFGAERVHADLHEFFPDMGFDDTVLGRRQRRYWTWMTREHVSQAASSTTVAAGIAERYHDYGVFPEVVTNSTHLRDLPVRAVDGPIRIVHSGNPFHERSLGEIMRAVATSPADVRFDLYLTAEPAKQRAEFVALADELGDRITVHDPVPQSALIETLNRHDVGIHVLQPVSTNNTMALPNKFFDFVQARLGIIIGPSPEMQRILEARRLGVVADGFDENAIRRAIDSLTSENVMRYKRASADAADALSSERQVETWAEAIDAIVRRARDAR
ncbi:glycosyltransferase family 4 protein [Microbacterium shaanxiense]